MGTKIKRIIQINLLLVSLFFTSNLYSQTCWIEVDGGGNLACGRAVRLKVYTKTDGTLTSPNTSWIDADGSEYAGSGYRYRYYEVRLLDNGPNSFEWHGDDGCEATFSVTNIPSTSLTAYAGKDQYDACDETNLMAQTPFGGKGTWSCGVPGVDIASPHSPTSHVSKLPVGPTTFKWTVKLGTCSVSDNVVIVNNTPTVSAGGANVACGGDSVLLEGSLIPSGGTGEWDVIEGWGKFKNENSATTWVYNLDKSGNNIFKWTVSNTICTASATVTVVNGSIELENITDKDTVCKDQGNLSVTGPGINNYDSGSWSVVHSDGTIESPNSSTTKVTGLNFGANTFRYTATKGECEKSIDVTIYAYDVEAIAGAGAAVTCVDSVSLDANDVEALGGTGVWSVTHGNGVIDDPHSNSTYVVGLSGTETNEFTWTVDVHGCVESSSITVDFEGPSEAVITKDTGYVCKTNKYLLNATKPLNGTGVWSTHSSGVNFSPGVNSATVTVSNLPTGSSIFVWTVSRGDCPDQTDTITVINQFPLEVDAGGPYANVCDTVCVDLAASEIPFGGVGTWTAHQPITFSDEHSNSSTACGFKYGENIITWTVAIDQCSDSDTTLVTSLMASAIAEEDFHVCEGQTYIHANQIETSDGQGEWTALNGDIVIDNPNSNVTHVSKLDNGGNTFYWTVTNGVCSDVDTLIVYNDTVSVVHTGPAQYICTDSAQLMATVPILGTAEWELISGGAEFEDQTKPDTWVTNLTRGRNVFRWKAKTSEACFKEDTVTIYNLSVDAYINQENPALTCSDSATITGNNPEGQNIEEWEAWGEWTVPSGLATVDEPDFFQTQVQGLPIDTTLVIWKIENDYCSDFDTLVVINNSPTEADAGRDTVVCGYTLETLSGNKPDRGEGFWRVVAGGATLVDPTLHNTVVNDLDRNCSENTAYWWTTIDVANEFEWVIRYKGCESTDRVRVLNGNPLPPDAGVDKTVCDNTVDLDALDEGSCSHQDWWEAIPPDGVLFKDPQTGAPDNSDFNAIADSIQGSSPAAGGSMTQFVWHKANEYIMEGTGIHVRCELTDTVEITSYDLHEDVSAGPSDAICEDVYTLNATPPNEIFQNPPPYYDVSGKWTVIHGTGVFDDDTDYNTTVEDLYPGLNILRWTLYNETLGCEFSDDVFIFSARPSNADAGADRTTCDDFEVLSQNVPAALTRAYWTIVGGGGHIVSHECHNWHCNTRIEGLTYGDNAVMWTVENDYYGPYGGFSPTNILTCQLTDTMHIFYYGLTADAGEDIYICADTAQLTANIPSDTVSGYWTGTTGLFKSTGTKTSTLFNDVVTGLTTGRNQFTWTLNNTICSSSDNLIVWNLLPPTPYANVDQIICRDSTYLNGNDITNDWFIKDLNTTDILQKGHYSNYWTAWPSSLTQIEDSTYAKTKVKGIPLQTEIAYIWHTIHDFVDYDYDIAGKDSLVMRCELVDTMTVYNNSVTAVAGSDDFVCGIEGVGAEYQLRATQVSAPQSGKWKAITSLGAHIVDPTAFNSEVNGMLNGEHVFQWTVSAKYKGITCSESDDVQISVRIPTTSTVAKPDSFEVCANTVKLQANNPAWGEGHWEDVYKNGGKIVDSSANPATVIDLAPGKTKWEWVIDNDGCISRDTITVINNTVYSDADDRIDPNVKNICVDTFLLSATDPNIFNNGDPWPASGFWSVKPGTVQFKDNTLYNSLATDLSSVQENIFTWTIIKGGCTAKDDLIVNDNEFTIDASMSTEPNHLYVCEDSVILDGEQPGTGVGTWTLFKGGGNITKNSLYNTSVTGLNGNDNYFEWLVTKGGCTAKDTVIVTNNVITAQAGKNDTVCFDTTSLAAGKPIPPATGTWTTSFGGGVVATPSDPNSHVSGMATDENKFIWTVTKGECTAKDTVIIFNNAPDKAIVEDDKEVCENKIQIIVEQPPVNGSGVWSLRDGSGKILNPTAMIADVDTLGTGDNTFLWTVTKGECKSVDTLKVVNNMVASDPGLYDTVCSNEAQLAAIPPEIFYPGQGVGTWSEQGGGGTVVEPTLYNTDVTGLGFGQNRFRWTVELGSCTAENDVLVFNYEVVATAEDIADCSFPVKLKGNNPVDNEGLWSNVGGYGTIAEPTLFNSEYDGLPTGLTNVLRWTIKNKSCADSIDIKVTNNSFFVNAGPSDTICEDFWALNATMPSGPGVVGEWSIPAGAGEFDDPGDPKTTVRKLGQGRNVLQWKVTHNDCVSIDSLVIVNNTPSVAFISNPTGTEDTITCFGNAILKAEKTTPFYATEHYWLQISGGSVKLTDTTDFILKVDDLDPGKNKFAWVVKNGECTTGDTIDIYNYEVASYPGNEQTICQNHTFLSATATDATFPYQGEGHWENLSGDNSWFDDPADPNTGVTLPNKMGSYTFEWVVEKGRCNVGNTVVINNASVFAKAKDVEECDGDIELNGNDPAGFHGEGKWKVISGGGTIANKTAFSTIIEGVPNGTATTVQWKVWTSSCTDSVQIFAKNQNFSVYAGPPQDICADTTTLAADELKAGFSGTWGYLNGNAVFADDTKFNTHVSELAQGENILEWTVENLAGCKNSAQVSITNNIPSVASITHPVPTNNPIDTQFCKNTVQLVANEPTPYYGTKHYWKKIYGGGSTVDMNTNYIVDVNDMLPGLNKYAWVIENGNCTASDTIAIMNNKVEANGGDDRGVCADSALLYAVDPNTSIYGGSGHWSVPIGSTCTFDDETDPTTMVHGLGSGGNNLQWIVEKGNCTTVADVIITNNNVKAIAKDVWRCDTVIPLSGNNPADFGGDGLWTVVAGPGTIPDSTNNITVINNVPNGISTTVQWKIANTHCSDSVQILVTNKGFTVYAGEEQTICSNSTTLLADKLPAGAKGRWTFTTGSAVFADSSKYNTEVTGLHQGKNILIWTVENNDCSNFDSVAIINNIPSTAQITWPTDTQVCEPNVILVAKQPASYYGTKRYWHQIEGTGMTADVENDYSVDVSGLQVGGNKFIWVIENGKCTSSDTITILNNTVTADAGPGKTVCEDSTFLQAVDPNTTITGGVGHWVLSPNFTFVNENDPATMVKGLAPNKNTLEWFVQKGKCTASAQVEIINNSIEAIAKVASSCDDTIDLIGNEPTDYSPTGTGEWKVIVGPGNIPNASDNITVIEGVPNGASTTVQWKISAKGCLDSVQILATNEGFNVYAGPYQPICTDTTTLVAEELLPGAKGHWELLTGNVVFEDSTKHKTKVSELANGENIFSWIVERGSCTAQSEVIIENKATSKANITSAFPAEEVCDNGVSLTAQEPIPYYGGNREWKQIAGTGTLSDKTKFKLDVTDLSAGESKFVWVITSDDGVCSSSDTITIVNNHVVAKADTDIPTCQDSVLLSAEDPAASIYGGTGHWVIINSGINCEFADENAPNTIVRNLNHGNNTFKWVVEKGNCPPAEVEVIVINNGVKAIAKNAENCDTIIPLTANSPDEYTGGEGLWSVVVGDGTIVTASSNNTEIVGVPNGVSTTVQWKVSAGECADSVSIFATNKNFSIYAGADQIICADTTTLAAGPVPDGAVAYWKLSAGGDVEFADSSLNNTAVSGLAQGDNILTWVVKKDDCENEEDVKITNNKPSIAKIDASTDTVTCFDTVLLVAQEPTPFNGKEHFWTQISGKGVFKDSTNFTTVVTDLSAGESKFVWTIRNEEDCYTTDTVTVLNNSVVAEAITEYSTCNDFVSLNATDPAVSGNGGVGHWDIIVSGLDCKFDNESDPNTVVRNLIAGNNTFRWVVENGECSDSKDVTVNNVGIKAIAENGYSCDTNVNIIGKEAGDHWEWSKISGYGKIKDVNAANTVIEGIPAGASTTIQWKVKTTECSDSVTIIATNKNFSIYQGPDQSICADSTKLAAEPVEIEPGVVAYWELLSGHVKFEDSTKYNTIVTELQKGENIFVWNVQKNGCLNSEKVKVYNNIPSTARIVSPADTERCVNNVELVANEPSPMHGTEHFWEQIKGAGTFDGDSTAFTVNVNGLSPDINKFVWTIRTGDCSTTDTITIVNNTPVAEAGDSKTICEDSTILAADDPVLSGVGGVGHWEAVVNGEFKDINNPNTWVTDLGTGDNKLKWIVKKGNCIADDNVTITNNGVKAYASDTEGCDSSIVVHGNDPAPGTGTWSVVSGGGSFPNSHDHNTTIVDVPIGTSTTVQWKVEAANGCADSVKIKVTNKGFSVYGGLEQEVCTDTAFLEAAELVAGETGYWDLSSGGADFEDATDAHTMVTGLAPGDNILNWIVSKNNCTDTATVVITNNTPGEAIIIEPTETEICVGNEVHLVAGKPTPFYATDQKWEQITGGGLSGEDHNFDVNVTGLTSGLSRFVWTVVNGKCSTTDTIVITNNCVIADAGVYPPVCSDSIQLHAVDPSSTTSGGKGTWYNLSGGNVAFVDSSVANTYVYNLERYSPVTLQWVVEKGGCKTISKVTVENRSTVAKANDDVVCSTDAELYAEPINTAIENGMWETTSGATFNGDITSNVCTVSGLSAGQNQFVWHVTNTICSDSAVVYISNNEFTVNADAVAATQDICSDTYTLSADNPSDGIGYWEEMSGSGTVTDKTLYNSTVTGLTSETTDLKWTVEKNNCTASAVVSITNYHIDAQAETPVSTCDDSVLLKAYNPNPGTGKWSKVVATADGNILTPNNYNTMVKGLLPQSNTAFYWTVKSNKGNCYDSVQVLVVNNGFDLIAGDDKEICEDTLQLSGGYIEGSKGCWKVISGDADFVDDSLYNTVAKDIGRGENVFQWEVSNGICDKVKSVTVTNNSVIVNAGSDQPNLCSDSTSLMGTSIPNVIDSCLWEVATGAGFIKDSTNISAKITGLSRNKNNIRFTVYADGCSGVDYVSLTNNAFDVEAGIPQPTCTDSAQLEALVVENGVGEWTPQGGTPATVKTPSANDSWVTGLQKGANTFRWTVQRNGCTFFDDVVITNNLPDMPIVVSQDDTICIDSIRLQAIKPVAGTSGLWTYTGSGGTIKVPTSEDTYATDLNLGTTVFIWTVTHEDCKLSDEFTVVSDAITTNAGSDQKTLCQDFTSLNAVEPDHLTTNYWWSKADAQPGVIENTLSPVTNVTKLGYGENKFVWNVKKGICNATDTVIIINNSASPARVGYMPPVCTDKTYLNATVPTYGNGLWEYIGTSSLVNIPNPNDANTEVTGLEYGANTFKWTVNNVTPYTTCSSDTTFVIINNEFEISAGETQIICDTLTHLEATTRPNVDSSYWKIITGTPILEDTTDGNSAIILGEGESTLLEWFVYENGCVDNKVVKIINDGVTAIAYDKEVCDSSTNLEAVPANSPNNGYWTCATPGVVYSPNNSVNNAMVEHLAVGANVFTWHLESDNCSDEMEVTVNYLVPKADAGPSIPICEDSHTLTANDATLFGGTGEWSLVKGSGSFADSASNNTFVENVGKGVNVYKWTVTLRECSNSDTVVITNNRPIITVGAEQNICDTVTLLTGNKPGPGCQGLWEKKTNGPHVIEDSTLYNSVVSGIETGSYFFIWSVWNSHCTASERLIINNNSVVANAGKDFETCKDSVVMSASLPVGATGYWESQTGSPAIIKDSTAHNTWVTNLKEGNNAFTWTIERNGCSDSKVVIVTNNMVYVDAGDDQDVCDNWVKLNGSNPEGGTGVWRLASGSCGSDFDSTSYVTDIDSLGQGANEFIWEVTRGICSNFDRIIVNNNQVFSDAGSGDASLCDTKFELNAIPPKTGEEGYWIVSGGYGVVDDSSAYTTFVRDLARGENILRWNIKSKTSECSSFDEVVINNITPSRAVTAPDKPNWCENYTTITANEPVFGVGHWVQVTGPSYTNFTDSLANSTKVNDLGPGPNKFAWIIEDTVSGCATSDTIEVVYNYVTAFAGLEQSICEDTFKLQASSIAPGYSGQWTKISPYGTFENDTVYNTVVRDLGIGPNTYRWTVQRGNCSAFHEVVINNNTATVADAGDPDFTCNGSYVLIGSTPGLNEISYWDNISGHAFIHDTARYWTQVDSLAYGENRFVWRIERENCESLDTVVITNNEINVYAGEAQEVCSDSVYLIGNVPEYGTGVWKKMGGSGVIANADSNATAVTGLANGVNTFRWIISEGACSSYDEIEVTNNEPTTPRVCEDTIYICSESTTLCANLPPAGEYGSWDLASGSGRILEKDNPSSEVDELYGNSSFAWIIKKGTKCVKSDTVQVVTGKVNAIVSVDTLEFCGPDGTLSANQPLVGSGYWETITGDGVIDTPTDYITDVSNLSVGANTFRWTVVSGDCSDSDYMVLLNNLYPATANMAAVNPICENEVIVIGNPPDAGAKGHWEFSAGNGFFEDSTSASTLAYDISLGNSTARWTIEKGKCKNYAEFDIINETIKATANSPVIVCNTTDTATLVGSDPAPGIGHWEKISGSLDFIGPMDSLVTSVTGVAQGSNILKWHVENGNCSDEVTVIVQNNFFTVTAGNSVTICDTTTMLSGTNPGAGGTGQWKVNGGSGSFEDSTSYITRVNGVGQGNNTYRWDVTKNGCSAFADVVITNGIPEANAGGGRVVCEDTLVLKAVEPAIGTGLWAVTGGSGYIENPTSPNAIYRDIKKGKNTLSWTVTNGDCSVTSNITIDNKSVDNITAGVDQTTCGPTTYLEATPPPADGYGVWINLGSGGQFADSSLFNTYVTGLNEGVNTFMWAVHRDICSNYTEVKVINNEFQVEAGPDFTVEVDNYTMQAEPISGTVGTWSVVDGAGQFGSQINNPKAQVTDLRYGKNSFRWTVNNPITNCSANDIVEVTFNGLEIDAGDDQSICEDSTCLDAQLVGGTVIATWETLEGSANYVDVHDPKTCVTNLGHGKNVLMWKVTKNGFTARDTVRIYNYKFDVDAGANQYLCIDSTSIKGSGLLNTAFQTSWSGDWAMLDGGGAISPMNQPNATYTAMQPDTNILKWEVKRDVWPGTGECKASDTMYVVYYDMPEPEFRIIPELAAACSPFLVQFQNLTPVLNGHEDTKYRWNFADISEMVTGHDSMPQYTFINTSEENAVDTVYDVTMTSELQILTGEICKRSVTHQVTVWPVPKTHIVPTPMVSYFSEPASAIFVDNESAENADSYTMDWGDGTNPDFDEEFITSYEHMYDTWGKYWIKLEVWKGRCSARDSQYITILAPTPSASGNNSTEICEDDDHELNLYGSVNYTTDDSSMYHWVVKQMPKGDTVAVYSGFDQRNITVDISEPGTFWVDLYASGEGSKWKMVFIRTDTLVVNPKPIIDFEVAPTLVMAPDQPIHCYNSTKFAETYLWNFGLADSNATSTEKNPIFIYTQEGEYTIGLKAWSNKGCMSYDEFEVPVEVIADGKLVFPTAFIPDHTGPNGGLVSGREYKNNVFIPQFRSGVVEYKLRIYNRWGELLYISNDVNVGWDGYIDGKLAPQDVYIYKVDAKFINGREKPYVGSVTLLR